MINQQLPYSTDGTNDTPESWLYLIKLGLLNSVKSNNYSPGCLFYVRNLNQYMELKYQIPVKIRYELIFILYHLTLTKDLEYYLLEIFSSIVSKLFKKIPDIIHANTVTATTSILPQTLNLPWRPLYSHLSKLFYPCKESLSPAGSKHTLSLIKQTQISRSYFTPDATSEILHEILPRININNPSTCIPALYLLSLFLPTSANPHIINPEHTHSLDWVPAVFNIWSLIVNAPAVDNIFLELFSRLCQDQITCPISTNIPFTQENIKWIMAAGLRFMELPIGGSAPTNYSCGVGQQELSAAFVKDKFECFSKFIIYTLNYPEYKMLDHLITLVHAIETFYHPSNSGRWTYGLCKFLRNLTADFLRRCRLEEKETTLENTLSFVKVTPLQRKITKKIKETFVITIRPLAYMAMFGKDSVAIMSIHSALRNLSWICPELVFPGLLERVYPSLESLSESHRAIACLGSLYSCSRSLLNRKHYPEGGQHLQPLLNLIIPGIDMNDPTKTSSSLMFLALMSHYVPLIDSSEKSKIGESEFDEICRLNTASFEDWILIFLSRILSLFENLPEQHEGPSNNSQTIENSLIDMVMFCCEAIFNQASERIQEIAIDKIKTFISNNVIINATKAIGFLCGTLSCYYPEKRLAAFFPICKSKILSELAGGASSPKENGIFSSNSNPFGFASMSDAPFHYYQAILHSCILTAGPSLLPYSQDLWTILNETFLKSHSKRGYKWSAKLLKNTFISLFTIYPREYRSHPVRVWESQDFIDDSALRWGENSSQDPEIEWHIPSNDEIQFGVELIIHFSKLVIDNINSLSQSGGPHPSQTLCRWLGWFKSLMIGISSSLGPGLPVKEEIDIYSEPYDKMPLEAGYAITLSKNPKLHAEISSIKVQLGQALLTATKLLQNEIGEDSIDASKSIIEQINRFILYKGTEPSNFDSHSRIYKYIKASVRIVEDKKKLPRAIIIKRAYLAHLARLKHNSHQFPKEKIYDEMVDILYSFCISKYQQVRKSSQSIFGRVLRAFPEYKPKYFPKFLEILVTDNRKIIGGEGIMEGAIQNIRSSVFLNLTLRNWEYARMFLSALVRSEKVDKTSTLDVIRKVFLEYLIQFSGIPFERKPSVELMEALEAVTSSFHIDSLECNRMCLSQQNISKAGKENYKVLIYDLLSVLKDKTVHWRFSSMSLNLIELVLTEEDPLPKELTDYVISAINSEHPAIRRICLTLVTKILVINKKRATLQGNNQIEKNKMELSINDIMSPKLNEYFISEPFSNSNSIPYLIDDGCNSGWLCWPTKIKAYKSSWDFDPMYFDEMSLDSIESFKNMYSNVEFWTQILGFMSQENSNGNDSFNTHAMLFYKMMFSTFGISILPAILPMVDDFISNISDKSKQRASTELLAGIVRGSKHLCSTSKKNMWNLVLPLFKKGITGATTESIYFWGECIKHMCGKHDPRRVAPLIELLCGNEFDPSLESFFSETKKVACLNAILSIFSWRMNFFNFEVLKSYISFINCPYQQIREALGKSINELLQIQWFCGAANVGELLKNPEIIIPAINNDISILINDTIKILVATRNQISIPENKTNYLNSCKTIVSWAAEFLISYRVPGLHYVDLVLPELFVMHDFVDQDLQMMSKSICQKLYPHFPHPRVETAIMKMVDYLNISKDENQTVSWHLKMRALPSIQIFYYRNLHLLSKDVQVHVLETVLKLLLYSKIEVRQLASLTLSGLIRCSQRDVILKVQKMAEKDLCDSKLPKRIQGASKQENYNEILIKRHSAVLGLSSLILAFPYEIPSWLPSVLVSLSKCSNEPSPIGSEVSKTFAEFRRTHQDTWHEDKLKFTQDQLYELSDLLISPGYYA